MLDGLLGAVVTVPVLTDLSGAHLPSRRATRIDSVETLRHE